MDALTELNSISRELPGFTLAGKSNQPVGKDKIQDDKDREVDPLIQALQRLADTFVLFVRSMHCGNADLR